MKSKVSPLQFCQYAKQVYGRTALKNKELHELGQKHDVFIPGKVWKNSPRRGLYETNPSMWVDTFGPAKAEESVPELPELQAQAEVLENGLEIQMILPNKNNPMVPKKDSLYVPYGNSKDLSTVFKTRMFYPLFIYGLSGCGKTYSTIQEAARLGREVFRVNFNEDTDDDALLGGYRLLNGDTVFQYGPVTEAMMRGAVLILDEIDRADPNRALCLQSILEGRGVLINRIGKFIEPKEGFTVIATANTKGRGSDDGKFAGANILDEAFLDRFDETYEQDYPTMAVEKKILTKYMESFRPVKEQDAAFIENVTKWATVIRQAFKEGAVSDIVSTRRTSSVIKSYIVFDSPTKAIERCVSRFDNVTKESFIDLYSKIDSGETVVADEESETIPF